MDFDAGKLKDFSSSRVLLKNFNYNGFDKNNTGKLSEILDPNNRYSDFASGENLLGRPDSKNSKKPRKNIRGQKLLTVFKKKNSAHRGPAKKDDRESCDTNANLLGLIFGLGHGSPLGYNYSFNNPSAFNPKKVKDKVSSSVAGVNPTNFVNSFAKKDKDKCGGVTVDSGAGPRKCFKKDREKGSGAIAHKKPKN